MEDFEEAPIDDVLKAIRKSIVDKERKEYFKSFYPIREQLNSEQDEVFELSENMLVNREDIPYQLGVWNFDDVAKKIMKKYRNYFETMTPEVDIRVQVKEDELHL